MGASEQKVLSYPKRVRNKLVIWQHPIKLSPKGERLLKQLHRSFKLPREPLSSIQVGQRPLPLPRRIDSLLTPSTIRTAGKRMRRRRRAGRQKKSN